MNIKKVIGKFYENRAKLFLENKGLKFITENFRSKYGEIDLIFWDFIEKAVVFVEVKYRKANKYGMAEESVNWSKQNKILITAEQFLQEKSWLGNSRCDVISISSNNQVNWVKNAF